MPRKTKAQTFQPLATNELVIIQGGNNFYIVRVGCQTFAFANPEDLLNALEVFLTDPLKAVKEFNVQRQAQQTLQNLVGNAYYNNGHTALAGQALQANH